MGRADAAAAAGLRQLPTRLTRWECPFKPVDAINDIRNG
jgi:hypothetical protein